MFDSFFGQVRLEFVRGILTSIVRAKSLDLSSARLLDLGFPLLESPKYLVFVLEDIDPVFVLEDIDPHMVIINECDEVFSSTE